MKELHKLEKYDFETIESFIKNSIEESVNIEFKAAGALSKKDADKKEVSKDVAAFANSDGGIIVYGISEKNHKADSFSFIDGTIFTKEWLEQIISSTIKRNIPDLKIFPIRNKGKIEESLYVVQIPSSIEAPHMSRDKRFYRRAQFESLMMEEYEVRSLYGRKVKSKIQLNGYSIKRIDSDNDESYKFNCVVNIVNTGEKAEKDYKVNAYLEGFLENLNISWSSQSYSKNNHSTMYRQKNDRLRTKISCEGFSTIYPNEQLDVLKFDFEIETKFLKRFFEDLKIEFIVHYSNGEDTMNVELADFSKKIGLELEH